MVNWLQMYDAAAVALVVLAPKSCARAEEEQVIGVAMGLFER